MKKQFRLSSSFGLLLCSLHAVASENSFQYFGEEIDFWQSGKKPVPPETLKPASRALKAPETAQVGNESQFSWKKVMDPNNKEFFKEGDYTPPEPFMEIVRNPTDENLKMWFSYIQKKNLLSDRLQKRMQDYATRNGLQTGELRQIPTAQSNPSVPQVLADSKRFRFRMYFDSHCPHCKKMFGTLTELQDKGFYVEAVQVDNDPLESAIPIPATRASPGELQEKDIKSVPLLLVGDLEKKSVYRLTGYHSTSDVFQAISQGLAKNSSH